MKLSIIGTTIIVAGFATPVNLAYADLHESTLELCERVKVCAYENLNIDVAGNNNQAVLEVLIDGLCTQIATPLVESVVESEHQDVAQTCLDDVLALNCSALMAGDAKELESCKSLKQLAEESGATFE